MRQVLPTEKLPLELSSWLADGSQTWPCHPQACHWMWTSSCLPQWCCLTSPDLSTEILSTVLNTSYPVQQLTYICTLQPFPLSSSQSRSLLLFVETVQTHLLLSILGNFHQSQEDHMVFLFPFTFRLHLLPPRNHSFNSHQMSPGCPQREVWVRVTVWVHFSFLFLTWKRC